MINVHLCRGLSPWIQEISDGLKCSPTTHCSVASAALPLHPTTLQLAFFCPPASWRCLKPVFFCIAHTPFEAKQQY